MENKLNHSKINKIHYNFKIKSQVYNDLNKEEKSNLIYMIINNDTKSLRKINISIKNLNFFFPGEVIGLNFDKEITPLTLCCYIGKLEVFNYLLSNDEIDVNLSTEPLKYSPLMIACYQGFYEIVRELLERNADLNAKNYINQKPIIFCFSRLDQNSFKYENKKICFLLIELLLANGADINTFLDSKNNTILTKLLSSQITTDEQCSTTCELIKFLISKGINKNIKNIYDKNVFQVLKENNKISTKYKEEIYLILNTKSYLNDSNQSIDEKKISFYNTGHARNKSYNYLSFKNTLYFNSETTSSFFWMKNRDKLPFIKSKINVNKTPKNELTFQTIDNNSSDCCILY